MLLAPICSVKTLLLEITQTSPGSRRNCLRAYSNNVGVAGGCIPQSSTRCPLPVTILEMELKWEVTTSFCTLE